MKRFENILFATQGLPGHAEALGQAMQIAANNRVPLTGLIACPYFPGDMAQYQVSFEQALMDTVQQSIDTCRVESQITSDAVPFPIETKTSEQPAVCIIKHAQSHHHDLIIKEAEPLNEGAEGFKAIDMTLLRKCPSAVWLQRPTDKPRLKRRVAVAIDPFTETEEHHALSLRLLELACSIADSCDSRLHVVSCWENYLESYLDNQGWIQIDEQQLASEVAKAQRDHHHALKMLISEAGVSCETVIHHLHGKPDLKIPESVEELDIDVLVMGTLARTGIAGFVIGNTAENILQSITCSLVAMKPEGFISPIR
ncbi:universal stress protein [Vibrio mexicanus]|uniref:universal stress protein n=1 Tax=Vibrio mexicanus TaxID=1004326 RepID=UPI00063CAEC0|nr:universal stress protein [Vibrio mexicanus]